MPFGAVCLISAGGLYTTGGFEVEAVENSSGSLNPHHVIRIVTEDDGSLKICQPNGKRFLTFAEQAQLAEDAERRVERLAAKLRALGIDPETV